MSFSISGRRAVALVGCAALSLSVAGCSSSGSGSSAAGSSAGSSSSSAGSSAASSHAATTAEADPDAGLPTGTQLKADLLSTGLPSGYSLDSSGSVDTGSDYQAPSDSQPANGSDCSNLGATSWVDFAGHGSVSFAENDYVDKATSEEFAQEIDAFQGTTAQAVMAALADITAKCPSYKDSSTGSTVKVSVATSASPEDGSVVITLSDSAWEGTTTLEAVRVGRSVVTVLCSTNSGSAAMAKSTATQIAAKVAAGGSK
ncbi:hypothetical protein KDK95_34650 [Actinospica sp. MGRD01-02]|uniref:Sensor domain-containing protein n=1 Tax=Actinospica acidithermotolerans TaxID=2828514 RepID=A0A941EHB2_9ACTN|nr:hypothetical protein [Actinospica acidithermotolerans]MBR7831482.1 hypothetical protein [Actinospica acidithermotolerans]